MTLDQQVFILQKFDHVGITFNKGEWVVVIRHKAGETFEGTGKHRDLNEAINIALDPIVKQVKEALKQIGSGLQAVLSNAEELLKGAVKRTIKEVKTETQPRIPKQDSWPENAPPD